VTAADIAGVTVAPAGDDRSLTLAKLFAALAKAQAEIEGAAKDKTNPHFGRAYADLASIWEACREPLSKNELCVVQQPISQGELVGVRTTLAHSSGEWMASTIWTKPQQAGPQAVGSCVTYLRRYSLAAVAGVAPDDDDGESAERRAEGKGQKAGTNPAPPVAQTPPPVAARPAPRANTVKHDGTFAAPDQVKLLHVLKAKVGGLSEDLYRKQLSGFKDCDGRPITTSTDLSEAQIANLIDRYKKRIEEQARRAALDPDLGALPTIMAGTASTITDVMTKNGIDEGELCAEFGVDSVRELSTDQAPLALQLVLAWRTDSYDRVLASVREKIQAAPS
jgi:hypothetical protein